MKTYNQLWRHSPENGFFGDCFRTCLGCLLDLKPHEVPHFFDGLGDTASQDDIEEAYKKIREWLAERGLCMFTIVYNGELEGIFATMKYHNPDIFYILAGSSGQANHMVIGRNDSIFHDPCPDKPGIVGPSDDGYFWVNILLPIWHREVK